MLKLPSFAYSNQWVRYWLVLMCLSVLFMICLGGITRLTDSGLSITEWQLITGIIPPSGEQAWYLEFNKYQASPEYKIINKDITLTKFKHIYIIEFIHRIAGRVLALLYIIPFIFFLIRKSFSLREGYIYLLCGVLLILQGALGWYMVQSGLATNPYISHFRLAGHLMLAVILYVLLFWQLLHQLKGTKMMVVPALLISIRQAICWGRIAIALILLQILSGALVAGLNAGMVYNSFPMMGDSFIPDELFMASINGDLLYNPVSVQFMHRTIAYVLCSILLIYCFKVLRLKAFFISVWCIFIALIIQVMLGILTIIYQVPLGIALLHQLWAIVLLSAVVWSYFLLRCVSRSSIR